MFRYLKKQGVDLNVNLDALQAEYDTLLQYDPLLKGAIRKNVLTERIDIVKSFGWQRDSTTLTDMDVKYLLLYFEENYGLAVEDSSVRLRGAYTYIT